MASTVRTFLGSSPQIGRLSLRFGDPERESAFRHSYFSDNLPFIRLAYVLGIVSWAVFALLSQSVIGERRAGLDLVLRFGVAIPVLGAGLVLTFTAWYERWWDRIIEGSLLVMATVWSIDYVAVSGSPRDLGFAGMMLILAFIYVLSRLRFVSASVVGAVSLIVYDLLVVWFTSDTWADVFFANYFLVSFAAIGMAAAYGLERFARLLFLRESELEVERRRADDLLANALPLAVVDRLKRRGTTPQTDFIADGLDEVSVLFADMVGFTAHAERIDPAALVALLDEVFSRFDDVAAGVGLEKIKTVGDAYMAVAGAPRSRADHADAAADMGLSAIEGLDGFSWPSGEPVRVRVGIASGPVVAGVIGRQRFAYDLWGDTVNLASRLETAGMPGRVLVSQGTATSLSETFVLSEPCTVELKGKGPTTAYFLERRRSAPTPTDRSGSRVDPGRDA